MVEKFPELLPLLTGEPGVGCRGTLQATWADLSPSPGNENFIFESEVCNTLYHLYCIHLAHAQNTSFNNLLPFYIRNVITAKEWKNTNLVSNFQENKSILSFHSMKHSLEWTFDQRRTHLSGNWGMRWWRWSWMGESWRGHPVCQSSSKVHSRQTHWKATLMLCSGVNRKRRTDFKMAQNTFYKMAQASFQGYNF